MGRLWICLVLMLGMPLPGKPLQGKLGSACDHAAPPAGMRWACSDKSRCDCRLVPDESRGEIESGEGASKPDSSAARPCLACRVRFFAIPAYPERARVTNKQGAVTATLVLTPEGEVQNVRIQSGDAQLASAVSAALRQWKFVGGGGEESIPVSVKFVLSANGGAGVSGASILNTVVSAEPEHVTH
jgi:TonB family protein